jgi:hypothetical protein
MKRKAMNIDTSRPLDIEGTEYTPWRMTRKIFYAMALAVLGLILWRMQPWPNADEGLPLSRFLAILCFIAALAFPFHKHTSLSFAAREIESVTSYAWFRTGRARRPLTAFSGIVVRHVCHPGGEGPDTYTGSVGLKPFDEQAVFWVKELPASVDEVPRAVYEFARALQSATGLPFASGSSES